MPSLSAKDVTKALQPYVVGSKTSASLPVEIRKILQQFVDEQDGAEEDEATTQMHDELKSLWEKYGQKSPQKLGVFVGIIKELRKVIQDGGELYWWQQVVKPVIDSSGYPKAAVDDAKDYVVQTMLAEEEDQARTEQLMDVLCKELLEIYIASTRTLDDQDVLRFAAENAQIAYQVEDILVTFGRKRPKELFHRLDDLVRPASTRLQALTLLSSFLRYQAPHLYLVINTPLVEDLLKCLMNDTSTTVLSVALTSLIMLLPHIPGSLGPYLPRLFLVYSRLLCWEKFSHLSTEAERNLVTDDRLPAADHGDDEQLQDVGIDASWEKIHPPDGVVEGTTPELMTYFTYLYGLYPLNFLSYVRKPRRYLKNIDFPGADAFDLDQAVIRGRTEQFRQVHILHPNMYHMSTEEELEDPKWPKMDPADVVGDCHALCVNLKPSLASPGPPPTGRLPDIPPLQPLAAPPAGNVSPTVSHFSVRSGNSPREVQSLSATAAEGESPILKSHVSSSQKQPADLDQPLHGHEDNLAYLQRQITLLRNDLNFERWHKAQYSTHIGQIMRRNVREATVEAETLNLINANRALKKQVEQMRKAREATQKDSALTRKQANLLEADMTERFEKFKQEQAIWRSEADELRRLRSEISQYRELLVATEAKELNKSHELQLAKRDLEELDKLREKLKQAQQKLHEFEYREFEFDTAKRQAEILQGEKEKMLLRMQRNEQEHIRLRQAYAKKVTELESQLGISDAKSSRASMSYPGPDVQSLVQQAVSDSEGKLAQLKKAYTKLVEKHTDLELEYQSLKSRVEASDGGQSFYASEHDDFGIGSISEYTMPEQNNGMSMSEPNRRFHPGLYILNGGGRTGNFDANPDLSRKNSVASRTSSQPAAFNQSAPLGEGEDLSAFSDASGSARKEKIGVDSSVRVYGRGGAQNIKLKPKKSDSSGSRKSSGLKGLRNFI